MSFITSQPLFNTQTVLVEDKYTPLNNSNASTFSTFNTDTNSMFVIEDKYTPIIPNTKKSVIYSNPYGKVTIMPQQNNSYYYDSIADNPIAKHTINADLRYKFLDKWLYSSSKILRMLKVDNGNVRVLSVIESEKNDISKDSEDDLLKKSDFIGDRILSFSKNSKILDAICRKNNLRYYDLPHNERYVRHEQEKYVKRKLSNMQK